MRRWRRGPGGARGSGRPGQRRDGARDRPRRIPASSPSSHARAVTPVVRPERSTPATSTYGATPAGTGGSSIRACSWVQGWPAATCSRRAARFMTTEAMVTVWSTHGSDGIEVAADALGVAVVGAQGVEQRGAADDVQARDRVRRLLGHGVAAGARRLEEVVRVGADDPADDVRAAGRELDAGDVAGRGDRDRRGGADRRGGQERDRVVDGPAGLQRLAQQDVDRRAVQAAVGRRGEQVQADAEARVVEADLGQHAGLGERREPAVALLHDPDHGRGREVRVPVPVLGQQPARADDGAFGRPGAGEDLGARVDRDQFELVHARAGGDPGDLLARLGRAVARLRPPRGRRRRAVSANIRR